MKNIKVGDYCSIDTDWDYGIVKIIKIVSENNFLFEYDIIGHEKGYVGKNMISSFNTIYPKIEIKEGKDYEGMSNNVRSIFKLIKKVRKNKLSDKMYYDKIFKDDGEFLYIKENK